MRLLSLLRRRADLDRIGHKVTQPGSRRQAIAFWRRCALVYIATRFDEDQITSWKPSQPMRREWRRQKVS